MSWDAFHRREDVLRTVADEADRRRDGALPTEVPGVAETFPDDFALVTALQMRWHTHMAGRLERALMHQPDDLDAAVVDAWRVAADELAGVRQVLDRCAAEPTTPEMGESLRRAAGKDHALMAAMAGRASVSDAAALLVGRRLEQRARAGHDPAAAPRRTAQKQPDPGEHAAAHGSLLHRIKAHLAA